MQVFTGRTSPKGLLRLTVFRGGEEVTILAGVQVGLQGWLVKLYRPGRPGLYKFNEPWDVLKSRFSALRERWYR